jgi:putative cardiolipin synthase
MFKGSSSQSSLHAKYYIIDRQDLIIGSFNMDPRSIEYNTEQVLVIHSKELAQSAADTFERAITPSASFHVMLAEDKVQTPPEMRNTDPLLAASASPHLVWVTEENSKQVHYDYEPGAGFTRQFLNLVISGFPVDNEY